MAGNRLTDLPNFGGNEHVISPCRDIKLEFPHGLGDCTYFAHQIPIYIARGYTVAVHCRKEFQDIFRAAGASILERPPKRKHSWPQPVQQSEEGPFELHQNKAGINFTSHYMPLLPEFQRGEGMSVWRDYCNLSLNFSNYCSKEDRELVDQFLADFQDMPIITLHATGYTCRDRKDLKNEEVLELQKWLISRTDAAIIILDEHEEASLIESWRIRRFVNSKLSRLWWLQQRSNLFMGIDSGPLHFLRFTETPAIGIWPDCSCYPWNYFIPRTNTINAVPHRGHKFNKYNRVAWNIYECYGGSRIRMQELSNIAVKMLEEPRYLPYPVQDIQLQQFMDMTRSCDGQLSQHIDRDRGFQHIFSNLRIPKPHIVEIGTIRQEEDWRGAGFSTYLFGFFTHYMNGSLTTVDINQDSIEFAKNWCSPFNTIKYHCCSGEEYLQQADTPIDLLYLDGHDTYEKEFEGSTLREAELGLPRMSNRGIIAIDDTVYADGKWRGKGKLAVPWLIERGWRIIYSGYQTILARQPQQTPLFGLFQDRSDQD